MTTRTARTPRRAGYTLLELLVASAIATLLMLALYRAFDLTVTQTNIGRERVAHTDLARAIVARFGADIANTVGLLPPKSGQTASGGGAAATGTTTATLLQFQAGVIGDGQSVNLFVSKVPIWSLQRSNSNQNPDTALLLPPDLKRVTYYLVEGGGLCRQERPWVTAAGTGDTTELDTAKQADEVIAPEATALSLEYLNGTGWDGEWDGASGATDDSAMMGPPRAIKVTVTFSVTDDDGQPRQKVVSHVFPIRAAIGNYSTSSTSTGGQKP